MARGMVGVTWWACHGWSFPVLQREHVVSSFVLLCLVLLQTLNTTRLPSWTTRCQSVIRHCNPKHRRWGTKDKDIFILAHNFKAFGHLAPSSWTSSKARNRVGNTWLRRAVHIMGTRKTKSCLYNSLSPKIIQAPTQERINLFMRPESSQCSNLPKSHIPLNTVALRTSPSTCGTWGPFKIQVIVSGPVWSNPKERRTLLLWRSTWTWLERKTALSYFDLLYCCCCGGGGGCVVFCFVKTMFKHISHWTDRKSREKWERI